MKGRAKPLLLLAPLVLAGLATTWAVMVYQNRVVPIVDPGKTLPPPVRTPDVPAVNPEIARLAGEFEKALSEGKLDDAATKLEALRVLDAARGAAAEPRLKEARREAELAARVKEADAAAAAGDPEAEVAALTDARRIRESAELKSREEGARARMFLARARKAEAAGDLDLAAQHLRESLRFREDAGAQEMLKGLEAKLAAAAQTKRSGLAEALAAEGMTAKSEGRVTTARQKLKEALALEDRPEWRKALGEAEEMATLADRLLKEGLALMEKAEYEKAREKLERAAMFNREEAQAAKSAAQARKILTLRGMVAVPGGTVPAGGAETAVKAFWIDRTEVTVAQWSRFLEDSDLPPPAYWGGRQPPGDGTDPVMNVSSEAAALYAAWAGKRLPTEAEWMLAAGGADGRRFPWGSDWDAAKAVARAPGPKGAGRTEGGASPCGALDMAGNVAEWTSSSEGGMGVVKGGSFLFGEDACAIGWRLLEHPDLAFPGIGFRCAADAE
jgi:formylglycine-generating enzyme required for sulfatase activity